MTVPTMILFEVSRIGEWSVASAFAKTDWYAWAKRGEMETDSLLHEPGDVWFQHADTREEAVAKVIAEVMSL